MKNNIYQKIASTVRYRILSLEEEVDILDEEALLISHVPGTTEIDQKKLVLLRNVKSVLHDTLLSYYIHFTSICPTTTTSISEVTKYHLQVLKLKEIEILVSELFGQQSALNTFVGQDYYKYSRDYDVPDDMKLRLLAQVFPFEFEFDLLSDSSFFEFLLQIVNDYQVENHEEYIRQLFERISVQQPTSFIFFFTADSPLYFCLAEHFLSSFVHSQMIHFEWDPLENFSIYQKCRLIASQGPLSCSIKPSFIELLKSAQGNDKILEIIKNTHNRDPHDDSFYSRPFISRFNSKNWNFYNDHISDSNSPLPSSIPTSSFKYKNKVKNKNRNLNENSNENSNDNLNGNVSSDDIYSSNNSNNNYNSNSNSNSNYNSNENFNNDNSNVKSSNNDNSNTNSNNNDNSNINSNNNDNSNINSNNNDNSNTNSNNNDNSNINSNNNDNSNINSNNNDNSNINSNNNDNSNINSNDVQPSSPDSFAKASRTSSSPLDEEVDKIRQENQNANIELPQLWHVTLDLKRLSLQTSPSFVLCVLSNSLRLLTNAITIDGNFVGGEEILEFFVFSLALAEPKYLPALCSFTDRFLDGGLKDETKFSYLLTQLTGALTFIQQRLLKVPPCLLFPFKKPLERLRGSMKRVESDIVMRGFKIYAMPTFLPEKDELFPAFLQYTGNEDDVAICSAFSFSIKREDETFSEIQKDKNPDQKVQVFPLNMPYFEVIPTLYGSFLQLTDEYINQFQMIQIDEGNFDDKIDAINAISITMKLLVQKGNVYFNGNRIFKVSDLNDCFVQIGKKWDSRINKNFLKYNSNNSLLPAVDNDRNDDSNDDDLNNTNKKFIVDQMMVQKLMLLVAEMQKSILEIRELPPEFAIDGVLNSWTWDILKEMFNLDENDIITPSIFDDLSSK